MHFGNSRINGRHDRLQKLIKKCYAASCLLYDCSASFAFDDVELIRKQSSQSRYSCVTPSYIGKLYKSRNVNLVGIFLIQNDVGN